MSNNWFTRVKKLALAYETGWEYIHGSDEAGSVLTDAFLEMEGRNNDRFRKLWRKHELEFLQAVHEEAEKPQGLRTALVVASMEGNDGEYLEQGTAAYTVSEQSGLIRFRTKQGLQLTAAALRYGIYKKGLSAWLVYSNESGKENYPVRLFQAEGEELACPLFRWYFKGLCDGRADLSLAVEFGGSGGGVVCDVPPDTMPSGDWTISDGQSVCPIDLKRTDAGLTFSGKTPEFAGNLEDGEYELQFRLPPGTEPDGAWMVALCGSVTLKEAADTPEPERCITDEGACGSQWIYPFGQALQEASCCYLACDRAAAGRDGELVLRFTEEFEVEERIPEPPAKEYAKLYKKYPWLKRDETVREWQAGRTTWEYFDGSLWRTLPGSETWKTGCSPEDAGEKTYRCPKPHDMRPCMLEGEKHFYIRLRLVSVCNAYAEYYRKRVPVLRDVRFQTGEHILRPYRMELPQKAEWQENGMYLGFDREVTADNRWYTGGEVLSFAGGQLKGHDILYGKAAFWVELGGGETKSWPVLLPNYVEVQQETGAPDSGERLQIPVETAFSLETAGLGVLDAVSVTEARYSKGGPPVLDRKEKAENFFAHYGRLVTAMDLELLLRERYPYLRVEFCSLQEEAGELWVKLKGEQPFREGEEELLLEIGEWLEEMFFCAGSLWLSGVSVKCSLS